MDSKKILLLLSSLLIFSCGASQNYLIKYNNTEPSENQIKIIKEIKKENEVMLFFDGGYKDDEINIYLDDKNMYSDVITTDNTLGVAKSYSFLKSYKKIKIVLNQDVTLELDVKEEYPFINIEMIENKLYVEYRKIYKSYK